MKRWAHRMKNIKGLKWDLNFEYIKKWNAENTMKNIKGLKWDLNFEYINKWNTEHTDLRTLKDWNEIWILNT